MIPNGARTKCPKCDGRRGAVIATVTVKRHDQYGTWTYRRFTHRRVNAEGYKKLYCYVRIKDVAG